MRNTEAGEVPEQRWLIIFFESHNKWGYQGSLPERPGPGRRLFRESNCSSAALFTQRHASRAPKRFPMQGTPRRTERESTPSFRCLPISQCPQRRPNSTSPLIACHHDTNNQGRMPLPVQCNKLSRALCWGIHLASKGERRFYKACDFRTAAPMQSINACGQHVCRVTFRPPSIGVRREHFASSCVDLIAEWST